MRVGISTVSGSPTDMMTWSGTPAHLYTELQKQGADVVQISPRSRISYMLANTLSNISGRTGNKLNWEVERAYVSRVTDGLVDQSLKLKCDVLIAMGWIPLSSREARLPIIYWGDATIGQRLGKSPHWSNLCNRTVAKAQAFEAEAYEKADLVVMASNWARDDTIERYKLPARKVRTIPFGANIADPQLTGRRRPSGKLALLTIGVKWHRKGIDTAVLTMDKLIERGVDAELHVVGVSPPDRTWYRPYVHYWGFLAKEDMDEARTLSRLFRQCDVFLLPTRNDPFCLVVAEAAAHGMPVVATNVGGVPERIEDGGVLVDVDSTPEKFADSVLAVISEDQRYERFSMGAIRDFHSRTSWPASARALRRLCSELCGRD